MQLVAALWFGSGWFARGDGFEVYSTLLGRMSPFGRREDGRLVLRSPLDGVDGLRAERGLVAVVMVLIGSTGFDGLSRTQYWAEGPGQDAYLTAVPGTIGLIAMIALASLLFVGATLLCGVLTRHAPREQPRLFAHSLVPIAAGYAIAHYFSLLLLDGQATWILASNPFGREGVDLFGTYGNAIDYTAISPRGDRERAGRRDRARPRARRRARARPGGARRRATHHERSAAARRGDGRLHRRWPEPAALLVSPLAHGGGAPEVAMVGLPLLLFAVFFLLERRARRQERPPAAVEEPDDPA